MLLPLVLLAVALVKPNPNPNPNPNPRPAPGLHGEALQDIALLGLLGLMGLLGLFGGESVAGGESAPAGTPSALLQCTSGFMYHACDTASANVTFLHCSQTCSPSQIYLNECYLLSLVFKSDIYSSIFFAVKPNKIFSKLIKVH